MNFRSGRSSADELRQLVQRQHAVDDEDRRRAAIVELLGDEVAQVLGHPGLDLEADHRAAAALLQRRLEEADQVLGLFLDLDVAVADDPEAALPLHRVAGEQPPDEQRDHLLERDEAGGAGLGESGRRMKRSILRGQADQRVAATRPSLRAATSCSAIEKPRLGMNGNGCAGSIASGVSTGKM